MKLNFIVDPEIDKSYSKIQSQKKEMNDLYSKLTKEINKKRDEYQKSWNKINDSFSKYVENITGYPWVHQNYICVLSVMFGGISNWGTSNIILRSWNESPDHQRKITAHELILSHYFSIIKKHYTSEKLKDEQIWALAEISAFALTSLTSEVKRYWPWDTKYPLNHNYPQIVDLQIKLKDIFVKRIDFDDYIKKGIELIKKHPNIGPESNI